MFYEKKFSNSENLNLLKKKKKKNFFFFFFFFFLKIFFFFFETNFLSLRQKPNARRLILRVPKMCFGSTSASTKDNEKEIDFDRVREIWQVNFFNILKI